MYQVGNPHDEYYWTTPHGTVISDNKVDISIEGIYTLEVRDGNCAATSQIKCNIFFLLERY